MWPVLFTFTWSLSCTKVFRPFRDYSNEVRLTLRLLKQGVIRNKVRAAIVVVVPQSSRCEIKGVSDHILLTS